MRISQQASQLSVEQVKVWSRRAMFTSEAGGWFTDKDFHAYLKQQGVERERRPKYPKTTEWHRFAGAPKTSLEYLTDFAGQDFHRAQASGSEDYTLRPEQQAAVEQALAAFEQAGPRCCGTPSPGSARP